MCCKAIYLKHASCFTHFSVVLKTAEIYSFRLVLTDYAILWYTYRAL